MRPMVIRSSLAIAIALSTSVAAAAVPSPWTDRARAPLDHADVHPVAYRSVTLDVDALSALTGAARREVALALPTPEGGIAEFVLEDSGTMAPELAAAFPEIRSWRGHDADGNAARVDVSPLGLQAMVFERDGGRYVVQPESFTRAGDAYLSFRGALAQRERFRCDVRDDASSTSASTKSSASPPAVTATGQNVRNLRTVVAATGEYTAFFGGTVAGGQAAIVTAMNRVNQVYEREFSVHMTLVANNSSVVYTNAITDPYTNDDGVEMLDENQTNLDTVIGTANYDIGHVFSTGGGGVAVSGLCSTGVKAQGVTGLTSPVGDPFYIDYVAHEMGHQFSAAHTFNSTAGFCFGNRSAGSAYEPGSGSTIMGYAGICDADDLQNNSDAYFHTRSLDQIANRLAATTCGTSVANTNQPPTLAPLPVAATVIPAQTPFMLVAPVVTDPDGDAVTYAWEQFNLGASTTIGTDNGTSPIIRSFAPTSNRVRTIPRLSNLLANTTVPGEILPQVARAALIFRLTVRDGVAPNGRSVTEALPPIQVVATAGPFLVTSPNTAVSWPAGSSQTVTWNVANTSAAPVGCANVDIALSTDGGNTFPTTLATATANDGSESIIVPASTTTSARVRVMCSTNIFFDLSNVNFTIGGALVDPVFSNGFE